MNAAKILENPRVRGLVINKMGKEIYDLFKPWLRDIAQMSSQNDKELAFIGRFLQQARINAGIVQIGLNPFTVLLHGTTAYFHSLGEAGLKEALRTTAQLFGPSDRTRQSWDFIMQNSGEMRHRHTAMDDDLRNNLKTMMGLQGKLRTAQQKAEALGYYFIGKADMFSAGVAWLARYNMLVRDGMEHDDAVMEADRAVRMSHGSTAAIDKAAYLRSKNEFIRSIAMFSGFYNHVYNRVSDAAAMTQRGVRSYQRGDTAGAERDFADALSKTMLYIFLPSMLAVGVRGALQGRKPEDMDWFTYAGETVVGEMAAMVPGIRDIAGYLMDQGHGAQLAFSPLSQAIETALAAGRDVGHWAEDEPVSDRWIQHAINTAGYLLGLPTAAPARALNYIWDWSDGEIQPQDVGDFMSGLLKGPPAQH